jgi:pimeloyl-ACP methyl ester carboxylesterase
VPSLVLTALLITAASALALVAVFLIYIVIRYTPIIGRIFEDKPMFLPLRAPRAEGAEDVTLTTEDGLTLAGSYLPRRTAGRTGVLVFCHEYLSDRWSALPYLDGLRDLGFDLFTFDFRNHGESAKDPVYKPLQWVTDHELFDLRAALAYLKTRPDADPAGVGLFGVSRGGGTALCVAASDPGVWGVATDGAFPTRGTMLVYILRWAEIFVGSPVLWKSMPTWVFEYLGWASRVRTEFKLHCRYANVEAAAARLAPRPWLAIHGQKDAYIGVDIARALFARAGEPKELWVVEGAKHNRSREKAGAAYFARLSDFFGRSAPRRTPVAAPVVVETASRAFEPVISRATVGVAVPG